MAEINQALVQYFETVAGLKGKQETTNAAHGQTQLGSVTVTEEELTSLRATALERLPERATKAQVQKRRNARDRLLTLLYQRAAAGVRAELEEEHRRFVLEKGHTGTKAASKEHSENLKQYAFSLSFSLFFQTGALLLLSCKLYRSGLASTAGELLLQPCTER